MTCKNKVNKTPVHRLSSFYNDYFNSVHPKIQQGIRIHLSDKDGDGYHILLTYRSIVCAIGRDR